MTMMKVRPTQISVNKQAVNKFGVQKYNKRCLHISEIDMVERAVFKFYMIHHLKIDKINK